MNSPGPVNLQRFIDAQASTYANALNEIRSGHKTSHWMWFIFPQIAGLGHSAMAQRYAISGRDEAAAYLAHPLLGGRLRECAEALNRLSGSDAEAIFGRVDAMKLKSSLTLFDAVDPEDVFATCLAKYYGGLPDAATLHIMGDARASHG